MKKTLCVILSLLLTVSLVSFTTIESSAKKNDIIISSDNFGDYYEDNDIFVIVQKNALNKPIALAVNFKRENIVREYIGDDIPNMQIILENINKDAISWDKEIVCNNSIYRTRSSGEVGICRDILIGEYGREYFDKYISGKNIDGVVGTVYEDMLFDVYYDYGDYFKAGVKVVSILAKLGIKGSSLIGIASVVKDVYDVYILAKDMQIDKYVANVNYNREAKVNDRAYDRAGKTIKGVVVFADIGQGYTRQGERTSGDFDYPNKMIERAVYIYNTRGY